MKNEPRKDGKFTESGLCEGAKYREKLRGVDC